MIEPSDPRSDVIREFHRLYYDGLGGAPPQKRISYLGVETVKCPLDLWIYQEILHRTRPEVIIECGVFRGGTTLYLANLCDLLGLGEVLACDITLRHVHPRARAHPRVRLMEGSSTDSAVHGEMARLCRDRRTMVILDSDHSEPHVAAELRLYGPLVSPGCYLICEDTNINGHPVYPEFGPGPYEAVRRFLAESEGWRVDVNCEKLLVTFNPTGYLLRVGKAADPAGGPSHSGTRLASVIVPCFNRLELTRECVASLVKHTRPPWELIAIDDGSTDGTGEYLAGLRDTASISVEVITHPANRGAFAARDRGLKAARGEFVVLLDNDTIVTDGCLDQLVALADSDPKVGMVGPMSNGAPAPQSVVGVPYADREGMRRFAAGWRSERRGKWSTVSRLSAFCLLLKRGVLEAIGGLDERAGFGGFGDEDLAQRVKQIGFTLALAHDLFVHRHGGSAPQMRTDPVGLGDGPGLKSGGG